MNPCQGVRKALGIDRSVKAQMMMHGGAFVGRPLPRAGRGARPASCTASCTANASPSPSPPPPPPPPPAWLASFDVDTCIKVGTVGAAAGSAIFTCSSVWHAVQRFDKFEDRIINDVAGLTKDGASLRDVEKQLKDLDKKLDNNKHEMEKYITAQIQLVLDQVAPRRRA